MSIQINNTLSVSPLNDPFKKQQIKAVRLNWWKIRPDSKPMIYAKVEFVNGLTSGEHEIQADSMDELLIKTKAFLETLPK